MEIALKIANKIKQNERFSVYILIPMWPEGSLPDVTQRILRWQVGFLYLKPEETPDRFVLHIIK